ncbi:MAG: PEP-CTERM sorting domain-containing protein [Chthoniobacterales bacterium]
MTSKTPALKAITTGLAGAAALAAGSEAYGAVVPAATLPINFTPTSNTSDNIQGWDVDGDGLPDFQFVFYQKAGNSGLNWLSGIYGYGGVGIAAPVAYIGPASLSYCNRLLASSNVGPSSVFNQVQTSTGGYFNVIASRYGTKLYGQWKTITQGFLGFEFTAADGFLHYGYIEIKTSRFVNATNAGGQFFLDAFYETDPNTPIHVQAVPEPGTMAALAFGAVVVAGGALRRRRKS